MVTELANFIQKQEPEIKGLSDKDMWRMKQFYETYVDFPKLSTLLREISWSHNLAIFSRCKTIEEREFYLKLAKQDNYSFRELDRQISASLFERTMIGNSKLSAALRFTWTAPIGIEVNDGRLIPFEIPILLCGVIKYFVNKALIR